MQMTSFVKVARVLDLLGGLDAALPERVVLPIARPRPQSPRTAACPARTAAPAGRSARPWTWGDEPPSGEADERRGRDAVGTTYRRGLARRRTREYATFQYDPAFVRSGIEVAPLEMPLREAPYRFPGLPADAFHGLPGLLADSLPDRWGNALIDAWLAAQGRDRGELRRRRAALLHRRARHGRAGVPARDAAPSGAPERTSRSPRSSGSPARC